MSVLILGSMSRGDNDNLAPLEPSPTPPPLLANEVHVWTFGLRRPPDQVRELAKVLSPDEEARAARFAFERLRVEATVARGVLRQILGAYLGVGPAALAFEINPQGKPSLAGYSLHFNLSHSGGRAVCAVTRAGPVGVDLELIRSDFDCVGLARQSFSAAEQLTLARAPGAEQVRLFFRCWSFKEAYIKGRGGGLSIPLDAFDVPLGPDHAQQAVLARDSWSTDGAGWYLRELSLDPRFAAAVALRHAGFDVRLVGLP